MIKDMFDPDEKLIWEGKPDRVAFMIGKPLQYLIVLIALAFYLISSYKASSMANSTVSFENELIIGIAVFAFVFVLLPIYRAFNCNFIQYVVTDKCIYFTSGYTGKDINVLGYTALNGPDVNAGLIDKLRNCASVRLNPKDGSGNLKVAANKAVFEHIPDALNVYKMIKEMPLKKGASSNTTIPE